MSSEQCWECEEEFGRNEVLDIPVFNKGWTVKWCFNCIMKQLEWSDYRLIPEPKNYKKFRVPSFEDDVKLDKFYLEELLICYKKQLGKVNNKDWSDLHYISWDNAHNLNEGEVGE